MRRIAEFHDDDARRRACGHRARSVMRVFGDGMVPKFDVCLDCAADAIEARIAGAPVVIPMVVEPETSKQARRVSVNDGGEDSSDCDGDA